MWRGGWCSATGSHQYILGRHVYPPCPAGLISTSRGFFTGDTYTCHPFSRTPFPLFPSFIFALLCIAGTPPYLYLGTGGAPSLSKHSYLSPLILIDRQLDQPLRRHQPATADSDIEGGLSRHEWLTTRVCL